MMEKKDVDKAMIKLKGSLLEEILKAMLTESDLTFLKKYPDYENQTTEKPLGKMNKFERVLFGLRQQYIEIAEDTVFKVDQLCKNGSWKQSVMTKLEWEKNESRSKFNDLHRMLWGNIERRLKIFGRNLSIDNKGEIVLLE